MRRVQLEGEKVMQFTGNAVLMGVRYHKTIRLPIPCMFKSLLQPVFCEDGVIRDVEFTFQGDYLCGDPIMLQTSGVELPDSWWTNESWWRGGQARVFVGQ